MSVLHHIKSLALEYTHSQYTVSAIFITCIVSWQKCIIPALVKTWLTVWFGKTLHSVPLPWRKKSNLLISSFNYPVHPSLEIAKRTERNWSSTKYCQWVSGWPGPCLQFPMVQWTRCCRVLFNTEYQLSAFPKVLVFLLPFHQLCFTLFSAKISFPMLTWCPYLY